MMERVKKPHGLSNVASFLDPSIFGNAPIEQFTKCVADFLYPFFAQNRLNPETEQLEIEAKFGTLIDLQTNQRLHLPIKTECVVHERFPVRFEATMSQENHRGLNKALNERVERQKTQKDELSIVSYKRIREIDEFYEDRPNKRKCRVTKNAETKQIVTCIEKQKLADLHVLFPYSSLDCRISVNIERKVDINPAMALTHARSKDRLSYHHEIFKVDLTSVQQIQHVHGDQPVVTYEMELEVRDVACMAKEVAKLSSPETASSSEYLGIIQAFVNDIKALAGRCPFR